MPKEGSWNKIPLPPPKTPATKVAGFVFSETSKIYFCALIKSKNLTDPKVFC